MSKTSKPERVLVGRIGVDAGLCWIGDPCYILHRATPPEAIGKDWGSFVDKLHEDTQNPLMKSFNYDAGHEGLGVCVSTGCCDGSYPVYAEIEDGRVKSATVVFMEDDIQPIVLTEDEDIIVLGDISSIGW